MSQPTVDQRARFETWICNEISRSGRSPQSLAEVENRKTAWEGWQAALSVEPANPEPATLGEVEQFANEMLANWRAYEQGLLGTHVGVCREKEGKFRQALRTLVRAALPSNQPHGDQAKRDGDTAAMTEDRFTEIKMSPRQASVTDVEDLCDEIERLRTNLRQTRIGAAAAPEPNVQKECLVQACRPEDRAMLATPAGAELLAAAAAALSVEPVAPIEGWKLVPIDPTPEMLVARDGAWRLVPIADRERNPFGLAIYEWNAMLSAAPQPPIQPAPPCDVSLRALKSGLGEMRSELTRMADELTQEDAAVQPSEAPAPHGYAYQYPGPYGGIRFNSGEEVNGSKPTRAIPYWFGDEQTRSDSAEAEKQNLPDSLKDHP